MIKHLILGLIFFLTIPMYAQKVVSGAEAIKSPKNGKLYFLEKSNKLVLFANKQFYDVFTTPKDTEEPKPPIPPVQTETEIGYWDSKDRILLLYSIGNGLWLMQKDKAGSYYVARGKNLLDDYRTVTTTSFDKNKVSGGNTDIGGLATPNTFPEADFLKATGRVKNSSGEYVKDSGNSGGGGTSDKIKIPVGVIRWDGWHTTLSPDDPIDITKETRYALSDKRTEDQAPFYSTFTADEYINKHHWNAERREWEYSAVIANVRFDGDRAGVMEKEIDYARSAGVDYWAFNYYATGSTPMARAREQFEALQDKKGMKAAYIMESIGGDIEKESKLIASAFRQDWYQKIDGKPLLILPPASPEYYDRIYEIYLAIKGAYGGEIYTVLQVMGYPVEIAGEVRKRGYNSHTRYSTWGGWNEGDRSHRYIMDKEWQWYQEAKKEAVDFTPNITVSFYQVGAQKSWGGLPDYTYSEKATDAEFEEQMKRTAEYVKDNIQVKTLILYSWNEYSEGGRTVSPQLRRNGTIDDRILKILEKYVE